MELGSCLLVLLSTLLIHVDPGSAMSCKKESILGITLEFECPMPGQSKDKVFCCGTENNRYCCDGSEILSKFNIDEKTVMSIAYIIAIVVAGFIGLVIAILICCCCCSCCLLAKRRQNSGHIISRGQPLQSQPMTTTYTPVPPVGGHPVYPQQAMPNPGYPGYPPAANPPYNPNYSTAPPDPGFKYAQPPPYPGN